MKIDNHGIFLPSPNLKIGDNYETINIHESLDGFDFNIRAWNHTFGEFVYFHGSHQTPPRPYSVNVNIKDEKIESFEVKPN